MSEKIVLDTEKNGKKRNLNIGETRIVLQPNISQSHYHLGQVLAKQEEWEDAIAAYRRALEIEPQGEIYFSLAEALVKQEREVEAIKAYQKAIKQQPNLARGYHNLGDLLQKQRRLEEAIEAYQKAIKLEPEFSWSHNNLGDVFRDLERWDEAIEVYKKAINLNPQFAWSHYNLAEAFCEKKLWDRAKTAYQKAINVDPQLAEAYGKLGYVLFQQEQFDLSILNYNKAIELKPTIHFSVYQNLSNALSKKQSRESLKIQENENYLQNPKVLNEISSKTILSESLTNFWREDNQISIEIDSCTSLLKNNSSDFSVYQKSADLFREKSKNCLDTALQYYHYCIQLNPDILENYYQALDINSRDAKLYLKLGNLLIQRNNLQTSTIFYQIAIQLQPDDSEAYFQLGKVLERQGKIEESSLYYRQADELNPGLKPLKTEIYHTL